MNKHPRIRLVVPGALVAVVVVALTSNACFLLDRTQDLAPGVVAGRAVAQGQGVAFASVGVDATGRTLRAEDDGSFLVGGLQEGTWNLRVYDDADGNGWPERARFAGATIALTPQSDPPRLSGVLLGDVELLPTLRVSGTVSAVDGGPAIGARVLALRAVSEGTVTEAETATDVTGAFSMPGLAAGDVQLIAISRDGATASAPASLVLDVPRDGVALALVAASPAPVDVVLVPGPTNDTPVSLTLVGPDGDDPGNAPDTFTIDALSQDGRATFTPTSFGPFDVTVAVGESSGALQQQVVVPTSARTVWGLTLLSSTRADPCPRDGRPRDCDVDGHTGLPLDTSGAPITTTWSACASTCGVLSGAALRDATCLVGSDRFDCDDDGDGQPDVTEPVTCIGAAQDLDGDGLCGAADPFPQCRDNDPAAVACGASNVGAVLAPPVRPEFGGPPAAEGEGEGEGVVVAEGEGEGVVVAEGEGEGVVAEGEGEGVVVAEGEGEGIASPDPLLPAAITATIGEDTPLDVSTTQMGAAAGVTVSAIACDAGALVAVDATTFRYTPPADATGALACSWLLTRASDQATAVGTLALTITPVDDAPPALPSFTRVVATSPSTFDLPATDVDGTTLVYTVTGGAQLGADGHSVVVTPGGVDVARFTVTVSDGTTTLSQQGLVGLAPLKLFVGLDAAQPTRADVAANWEPVGVPAGEPILVPAGKTMLVSSTLRVGAATFEAGASIDLQADLVATGAVRPSTRWSGTGSVVLGTGGSLVDGGCAGRCLGGAVTVRGVDVTMAGTLTLEALTIDAGAAFAIDGDLEVASPVDDSGILRARSAARVALLQSLDLLGGTFVVDNGASASVATDIAFGNALGSSLALDSALALGGVCTGTVVVSGVAGDPCPFARDVVIVLPFNATSSTLLDARGASFALPAGAPPHVTLDGATGLLDVAANGTADADAFVIPYEARAVNGTPISGTVVVVRGGKLWRGGFATDPTNAERPDNWQPVGEVLSTDQVFVVAEAAARDVGGARIFPQLLLGHALLTDRLGVGPAATLDVGSGIWFVRQRAVIDGDVLATTGDLRGLDGATIGGDGLIARLSADPNARIVLDNPDPAATRLVRATATRIVDATMSIVAGPGAAVPAELGTIFASGSGVLDVQRGGVTVTASSATFAENATLSLASSTTFDVAGAASIRWASSSAGTVIARDELAWETTGFGVPTGSIILSGTRAGRTISLLDPLVAAPLPGLVVESGSEATVVGSLVIGAVTFFPAPRSTGSLQVDGTFIVDAEASLTLNGSATLGASGRFLARAASSPPVLAPTSVAIAGDITFAAGSVLVDELPVAGALQQGGFTLGGFCLGTPTVQVAGDGVDPCPAPLTNVNVVVAACPTTAAACNPDGTCTDASLTCRSNGQCLPSTCGLEDEPATFDVNGGQRGVSVVPATCNVVADCPDLVLSPLQQMQCAPGVNGAAGTCVVPVGGRGGLGGDGVGGGAVRLVPVPDVRCTPTGAGRVVEEPGLLGATTHNFTLQSAPNANVDTVGAVTCTWRLTRADTATPVNGTATILLAPVDDAPPADRIVLVGDISDPVQQVALPLVDVDNTPLQYDVPADAFVDSGTACTTSVGCVAVGGPRDICAVAFGAGTDLFGRPLKTCQLASNPNDFIGQSFDAPTATLTSTPPNDQQRFNLLVSDGDPLVDPTVTTRIIPVRLFGYDGRFQAPVRVFVGGDALGPTLSSVAGNWVPAGVPVANTAGGAHSDRVVVIEGATMDVNASLGVRDLVIEPRLNATLPTLVRVDSQNAGATLDVRGPPPPPPPAVASETNAGRVINAGIITGNGAISLHDGGIFFAQQACADPFVPCTSGAVRVVDGRVDVVGAHAFTRIDIDANATLFVSLLEVISNPTASLAVHAGSAGPSEVRTQRFFSGVLDGVTGARVADSGGGLVVLADNLFAIGREANAFEMSSLDVRSGATLLLGDARVDNPALTPIVNLAVRSGGTTVADPGSSVLLTPGGSYTFAVTARDVGGVPDPLQAPGPIEMGSLRTTQPFNDSVGLNGAIHVQGNVTFQRESVTGAVDAVIDGRNVDVGTWNTNRPIVLTGQSGRDVATLGDPQIVNLTGRIVQDLEVRAVSSDTPTAVRSVDAPGFAGTASVGGACTWVTSTIGGPPPPAPPAAPRAPQLVTPIPSTNRASLACGTSTGTVRVDGAGATLRLTRASPVSLDVASTGAVETQSDVQWPAVTPNATLRLLGNQDQLVEVGPGDQLGAVLDTLVVDKAAGIVTIRPQAGASSSFFNVNQANVLLSTPTATSTAVVSFEDASPSPALNWAITTLTLGSGMSVRSSAFSGSVTNLVAADGGGTVEQVAPGSLSVAGCNTTAATPTFLGSPTLGTGCQ